jgi:hypothetical protein
VPIVPVGAGSSFGQPQLWPSIQLDQIACPSPSTCVATGSLSRVGGSSSGEVVQQQDGVWGTPVELTGTHALDELGGLVRLACAGDGTCVATDLGQNAPTLTLATRIQGHWTASAIRIPGSEALFGEALACTSRATCWMLVDQFRSGPGVSREWSYAVPFRGGRWRRPYRLGGPNLRISGRPVIDGLAHDITCWSPSSCTVLGRAFSPHASTFTAFVQTEVDGRWSPPTLLPPSREDGFTPYVTIGGGTSLACTSASDCLVSGSVGRNDQVGAVVQDVNGRWSAPVALGVANPMMSSSVLSVACHAPGDCVAAGTASANPNARSVAFVQVERSGHWRSPSLMAYPGFGAGFFVKGIECHSASSCYVVGTVGFGPPNGSFVARYDGVSWHWSVASVAGLWRNLWLDGLACARGRCWVSGTIEGPNGSSTGAVAPLAGS